MDYQAAIITLTDARSRVQTLADVKAIVDSAGGQIAVAQSRANTALLEAQALVGTAQIGIKSQLTQEAEKERLAGIGAMIDAIKANPTLDPGAAQVAWVAGVATVTQNPHLEDPVGIVSAIMRIAGCADWNAFLAVVSAGQKADLIAAVS